MIESCYWKEELARYARRIRRVPRPARWSERAHCVIERDLMVGFFMLRRLVELRKVSTTTRNRSLQVFSYGARGRHVTRLNGHDLWEMYDLDRETPEHKPLMYVANQFVHAYTSFVVRDESRNWSDVIIVSDYDRNDRIWRVPMAEIEKVFRAAAVDYPSSMRMSFNPKKGDYDVETD
jgi:hypothetical protein